MDTAEQPATSDEGYRALLTDREAEILSGEVDVNKKYYYRVVTRVRKKIQRLVTEDLPKLDQHDTLGDELREAIPDNIEEE